VGLVLIENGKSRILHQLAVQLLELLQGVLVVLAGTFRQDIHPEVGISDLFFVVLLVGRRELVSLPLKFLICGFELLLFVIETALNDCCTRQQTLLK